ncbi:MAG TPA: 4-(cytidine 5'-diphospho)-2-C-methyl-D-erythritol kinase [Candidatus Acidoferrales bacterium]|nr:4-(cytidine 5'-diphospho)-2-C-methyl-D-erythritol kinase [Candidatus Acidoferrales bacterium]
MSTTLRIPAYAKINLHLAVLGVRPDGYHELRTIFQAISLHDTLELERLRRPEIHLQVTGAALAADRTNLVYRALEALNRELALGGGWRARLQKRIPMGAGLGGGSSDAAAALAGGLRLAGRRLAPERLAEIAAGLGADVPFFLLGGRAVGVGRGDEIYPLETGPRRSVVVVMPKGIEVATSEAYGWLDRELTKGSAPPRLWISCARSWSTEEADLWNDFEGAVFAHYPRLERIKRRLLRAGAAGAALAGSGSAVFGLFRNPAQARRAARQFPHDQIFFARTLARAESRHSARAGLRA